jgi:hypothetical protein
VNVVAELIPSGPSEIPLWVKLAFTAFLGLLVPAYWRRYGPANFLWFSDIALIGTAVALWLESALLASMMAVGVLLPELGWNLSFFGRLLFGFRVIGLADYMFDARRPLWLRGLSLFHVVLPVLLLWLMSRLGYDARALVIQTLLGWIVLSATWLLTEPAKNINWVFGPNAAGRPRRAAAPWLALAMLLFPLCAFLPAHVLLEALFGAP